MKSIALIKNLKIPSYHRTSIFDSLLVIVFTTLPTVFVAFNTLRKSWTIDLHHTFMAGDFFLYCIAFLSSSYLVFNQLKISGSDLKDGMNKMILLALVLISGFYAIITVDDKSDYYFMKDTSILALLIGIGVFYWSQVSFNKQSLDVGQERRDEQKTITDSLR